MEIFFFRTILLSTNLERREEGNCFYVSQRSYFHSKYRKRWKPSQKNLRKVKTFLETFAIFMTFRRIFREKQNQMFIKIRKEKFRFNTTIPTTVANHQVKELTVHDRLRRCRISAIRPFPQEDG